MTEQDWQDSREPHALLRCLQERSGRRGPWRKLRLLVCCFCRFAWDTLPHPDTLSVLDVAERFADGRLTLEEMNNTRKSVNAPWRERAMMARRPVTASARATSLALCANRLLWDAAQESARILVTHRVTQALGEVGRSPSAEEWRQVGPRWKEARRCEQAQLCRLIRCLFGNPFKAVEFSCVGLTPTALSIAATAYEERLGPSGALRADNLAVLADALEDLGRTDADLLGHLRGPGPHMLGCWALDAVLGKQ